MRETLLTSSALILALILLRRLFRGKISPRLQYALWGLAALRLLLPCSLPASPMSLLNAAPEVPAAVERRILEVPDTLPVVPAAPEAVPEAAAPAEAEAAVPFSWETALRRVWLGGMVTVGAAFLLSNLRLARSLRKRRQPVKADCPIPVYAVSGLSSPCLFGRAIYLPAGAEEDEAALRHILAHELTHLKRLDPVWSLVRSFCLAVYWFDPLVWAAAVLSRRDCEAACDAATVQALGEAERFAYGRTLVRMVSRQNGFSGLLSTATTMTGGKKRIRERVELLARHPRALPVTLVCLAALIGILVGCTFTAAKQEAEPVTFQIEMPALVTVSRDGGHELYLRDGTLKWAAAELINGVPLLPAEEEFPFAEVTLTFEGETTHQVEFYGETLLRVDGAVYTRAEGKNDYSLIEELYGADNDTLFEAVLAGEKPFVFFNAGSKLTDLPGALSDIVEGCAVKSTTSLDLDGDGALECVLGLAPGDYGFLVLWRTGDTIYAQSFPYRGFRDLRTDGSFSYSSGAADSGIGKLRLTPSGAETEPETWSESDGTTVRFYVAGKPADEAAFRAAWDVWEALPLQMWDEVELSSLASLTDAALCAYALEADGAYAEGAGYELARRFRENPDGLAAAMEESGAPGRLALLLRSALEPGESFPLDEAKHSTIAALLGERLTPEGVQYLRTSWTEGSEGAWVLRSRAELEARAACAAEAYDAAFFETHDLILLAREEGSGSLRHRVDEVNLSPSGYFVLRLTILTPEVGTDDMAAWQILIPVPKGKAAAPAEMPLLTVWEPME